jgi:hypothetical protein
MVEWCIESVDVCSSKKGRCLDWWVDAEEYSIIDMEKDVLKHFTWAHKPIFPT